MESDQPLIFEIVTTVSNETEARELGLEGVESGGAACIQIDGPITSIYRWESSLQTSTEYRLIAKVSQFKKDQFLIWMQSHHPYQLPEILVRQVNTTERYANWVDGK